MHHLTLLQLHVKGTQFKIPGVYASKRKSGEIQFMQHEDFCFLSIVVEVVSLSLNDSTEYKFC
jgi:hypothetical protein